MLVECPHCYVRVDPQHKEGVCGTCGENVNKVDGIDPNRGLLLIRRVARMPELCCQCGIPTSEMADFQMPTADETVVVHGFLATPVFRPLVWLVNQLRRMAGPKPAPVTFRIPLCGFCRDKPFSPVPVHPSEEVCQYSVHIDFKKRYDVLNPQKSRTT